MLCSEHKNARIQEQYQGLDLLGHQMALGSLECPACECNTIFLPVPRHQCSGTKCEYSLIDSKMMSQHVSG